MSTEQTSSEATKTRSTGLIAWFTYNHVAANLLMFCIICAGVYSAINIKKAIMPDIENNLIIVNVPYPGAAPEEVEEGIVVKIEEAVKDLEGIDRISGTADENSGRVTIKIKENYDFTTLLNEVKTKVDSISTFPEEAEEPIVERVQRRHSALQVQIYGNLDETGRKVLADEIKRELLVLPAISYVEISGAREFEISVEISESTLRKYNLTLGRIATVIGRSSLDLPGGMIRTNNGEILLRTRGQAYNQHDFENIVLLSYPDGTRLTLGDIAVVNDGFAEDDDFAFFNAHPSVGLHVFAVGEQNVLDVAQSAREYIEQKKHDLPQGVDLDYWADITEYLQSRLDLMMNNMMAGALLVLIVLALFLDLRLALWVIVGLPVCFLGAMILLPLDFVNVSINLISLFGFILVLGVVVDDAIIIGESVHTTIEKKGHSVENVIAGTHKVAIPATFGVLTTIAAFTPMLFASGILAPFPAAIGYVVIFCLCFSLIESKLILPAHLAATRPSKNRWLQKANRLQIFCNKHLKHFVENRYRPFLTRCIEYRYATIAAFISFLIITVGFFGGGVIRFSMFPDVPADYIEMNLEMVEGTPDRVTRTHIQNITTALYDLEKERQQANGSDGFIRHVFSKGNDGLIGKVVVELKTAETRSIQATDIVELWRNEVGSLAGTKALSFSSKNKGPGKDIQIVLAGPNIDELEAASRELSARLKSYDGVYDLVNDASVTVDEINLSIKPGAEALGLSQIDLGSQVRQAFYGAEAQRIQRGPDEIKVMVRYPLQDRKTIDSLESMYIRSDDGGEIPLTSVANIEVKPGYSAISRVNRERAIVVSADVDKTKTEPTAVVNDLIKSFLPGLLNQYRSVNYRLDGLSKEDRSMQRGLFQGMQLSLALIFVLLAVALRSYLQPLIIMSAIPFGAIGAVFAHLMLGMPMTMMSFFGIIALSGVVVNDSLILVNFIQRALANGQSVMDAVLNAGTERFRAIMLTSLTTFFGLLPILLETSTQAQYVIPMAVSLGFGIVFATVITLILIPCLYIAGLDIKQLTKKDGQQKALFSQHQS